MAFQFLENLKKKAQDVVSSFDQDKSGNVSFGEVASGVSNLLSPGRREVEIAKQLQAQPEKSKEIIGGELNRSLFSGPKGQIAKLAIETARAPVKAITSMALQPAADILELATGKKEIKAEYKPETPFQKAIFGEEPILGFGERLKQDTPKAEALFQKLGLSKDMSTGAALAATPLFIGGMIGLDLTPIEGAEKSVGSKIYKTIAASNDVDIIIRSLDELMRGKPAAKMELAQILRVIDDPKQVERVVGEALTTARTGSFSTTAIKEAEAIAESKRITKIEDRAKITTNAIEEAPPIRVEQVEGQPSIGRSFTGDTFAPEPQGLGAVLDARAAALPETEIKRLATINLSKIKSEDDVIGAVRATSELFAKETAARARGVVGWELGSDLARANGVSPEDLMKLPAGSVLNVENAESIRSLLVVSAEEAKRVALEFRAAPTIEKAQELLSVYNRHGMIQTRIKAVQSETGRALQSFRKEVGSDIAEQQREAVRMFQQQGEKYGSEIDRLKLKLNAKSPEDAAKKLSEIIASYGDDVIGVSEAIANIRKANWMDKMLEFSVAAKLWTPTTHLVNMVGNIAAAAFRPAEKIVAGAFDFFPTLITGRQQERFIAEGVHNMYGMAAAIVSGIPDALHVFIETLSPGAALSKLDESSGATADLVRALRDEDFLVNRIGKGAEARTIQGGAIEGIKGQIIRTPFRALQASDAFFHTMNKTAEIHSLAYRQGVMEGFAGKELKERVAQLIKSPSDEMLEAAEKVAKEYTFQADLGKYMAKAGKLRQDIPITRLIFPFFNTPVNVAKFSMQRSPVGILSMRNWQEIIKGGGERSDALARIAVGSSLAGYMALLVGQGHITGAAPKDEKSRDKFYRAGKLPYSVKVGDTWYQYQRLEPLATLFSMAANYNDAVGKKGEEPPSELVSSFIFETGKHWMDQTFLLGLSSTVNAMNDPERYGKNWINNLVTGQIPSIIPFAARMADRTIRDPGGLKESILSKIPGVSNSIRPNVDAFGRENKRPGGMLNELSPVKSSKEKIDIVDTELDKLGIEMTIPSASLTRGGRKIKLSKDEELEVKQSSGKIIHGLLTKLMSKPAWATLSEEGKKKAVNTVINKSKDLVSDNVFVDSELRDLNYSMPTDKAKQKLLKKIILSPTYNKIEDAEKRKKVLNRLLK